MKSDLSLNISATWNRARFKKGGGAPEYKTPDQLWASCCDYFQWVDENPIIEIKPMVVNKELEMVEAPKYRAMTIRGLCAYLDISRAAWYQWRDERENLKDVISAVEDVIYNQKFTLAAADQINASIIARDLGLASKIEVDTPKEELTPWGQVKAGLDE